MEIFAPNDYNGALMGLARNGGDYIDMKYITTDQTLIYELPLAEVVTDFFDQMKTRTQGYASMEYSPIGYRKNQLVRLDVLINASVPMPSPRSSIKTRPTTLVRPWWRNSRN